jgi:hypothetical protein
MTRIKIKGRDSRKDKKLFCSLCFLSLIFMSLPLANMKKERKRERVTSKKESYANKIGRSNAKKGSVKLLF